MTVFIKPGNETIILEDHQTIEEARVRNYEILEYLMPFRAMPRKEPLGEMTEKE